MKRIAFVFLLFSLLPANAGEQTRIYGSDGRSVGTATTNGNMTTFRNDRGSTTGTATTTGNTTTFRDERGNVTGRTTGPAQVPRSR